MRFNFNDTLARTLRGLQCKDRHGDHTAASSAAASTNTFKESGYRYNHFEPNNTTAYLEAQSDIAHWLKDITNESYHFDTPPVFSQAAAQKRPITPDFASLMNPHVASAVEDIT